MKRNQNLCMKKILAISVGIAVLLLVGYAIVSTARFMRQTGVTPGLVARLIFDDGAQLTASSGRTNLLLLGIGGGTHEGADLTDTIIIVSLNNTKKTVALVSVPRDIWSDTLKDKVNSAYYYGQIKQEEGGLLLAKVVTEDVIGMPIHYAAVVDFTGFTKVIDAIGGIDVDVPESFTDTKYPIPGKENDRCPGDPANACLYQTVHFDAGLQHMDGDRALVYVRSRHAEGSEGSDFARGRRQQIIMVAIKDRMTHPLSWITLERVRALPKLVSDATDMDMNMGTVLTIAKRFTRVGGDQIKRISFDDMLINPPAYLYNNLYVLVPQTNWDDIHAYIEEQLSN